MDPSAEDPDPPSGSKPEEPETSPMAAVPAGPDVVWPEDPFEADGHAAEVEPDTAAPADPPWTQQAFGRPTVRPPHLAHQHTAPADDDPHTAPFPTAAAASSWSEKSPSEPSVGKTQPPPSSVMGDAMKTQPPTPRATNEIVEAGDEVKTAPPAPAASARAAASETDETEDTRPPVPRSEEAFKNTPPVLAAVESHDADEIDDAVKTRPPVPSTHDDEPAGAEAAADVSEPVPFEAEPRAQDPDSEPDLPVAAPPVVEPAAAASEPVPEPEPTPEPAPAAAPQPAAAAQPPPAPAATPGASEPLPWPAAPKAANPPLPSWAPRLQHPGASSTRPGSTNTPTWAPQITGNLHTASSAQPPAAPTAPTPPAAPVVHAPAPAAATPAAPVAPAAPAAGAAGAQTKPSWEIVQQEVAAEPAFTGPSPEDKSYAEWFAWAKRSGAPASACHAAAQGAFRALSTGQDMNVAVQWATLAMASPPGLVGTSRQLYCAWFSLGNIDLKLPTQQAHAFATGAIQALESGADSMVAHQMGLAAAGITAR
jgi:hypothetical protein